jgi:hypothetical protein
MSPALVIAHIAQTLFIQSNNSISRYPKHLHAAKRFYIPFNLLEEENIIFRRILPAWEYGNRNIDE